MIRVLLIEDELEAAEKFRGRVERIPVNPSLTVARSRDSAATALGSAEFDLIVCDLRIPSVDGGLDVEEAHGWHVLRLARQTHPGTPVILLSAVVDLPKSRDWLSSGLPDLFGDGSNVPSSNAFNKEDGDAVLSEIQRLGDVVNALAGIPIDYEEGAALSEMEERLLRIYAVRKHLRRVVVEHQYEGYSGATIVRARFMNDRGQVAEQVVCKFGSLPKLREETGHYDQHVAHLGPGQIAQAVSRITAGAGKRGAVVYALADGHRRSLYEALMQQPDAGREIVAGVRSIESRWESSETTRRVTIRSVRRTRITDPEMADVSESLAGVMWQAFEDIQLDVRFVVQHCDAHGGNVLLDPHQSPLFIDYMEVGEAPASLDPLTMELSVVLQAAGKDARGDWPTIEQGEDWADLEMYLVGCPFPDFIKECRGWAQSVAGSDLALAAVAYAYAVRQLRYPDTDHELALAIIRGLVRAEIH